MIRLASFSSPLVTWYIKPASSSPEAAVDTLKSIAASVAGFATHLFKQAEARKYPEIIALAYWFRQSNIERLTVELQAEKTSKKIERVFHIAPANVDTVFMYSVLLSVLCGNKNVVRVSQRSGDVTWLLISFLREYLEQPEGAALAKLFAVLEYDAQHESITAELSDWCQLRVIWGGDSAIRAISGIAPQTPQICFPDRYSVAVLELNADTDFAKCAKAFLVDLLPFLQQACSSPKALYWLNTDIDCQKTFWQQVAVALEAVSHQFEMSHKIEQHLLLQKLTVGHGLVLESVVGNKIASFARIHNVGPISHCKVKTLTVGMLEAHSGNGLVIEKDIVNTDEIACSQKLQTISYATIGAWCEPNGDFKRVVPMGKALEFDAVWDGTDLLQEFIA